MVPNKSSCQLLSYLFVPQSAERSTVYPPWLRATWCTKTNVFLLVVTYKYLKCYTICLCKLSLATHYLGQSLPSYNSKPECFRVEDKEDPWGPACDIEQADLVNHLQCRTSYMYAP